MKQQATGAGQREGEKTAAEAKYHVGKLHVESVCKAFLYESSYSPTHTHVHACMQLSTRRPKQYDAKTIYIYNISL